MWLVFSIDQDFFEKSGFRQKRKFKLNLNCAKKLIFLSFGDIYIFSNACAVQTNLGTKELCDHQPFKMHHCSNVDKMFDHLRAPIENSFSKISIYWERYELMVKAKVLLETQVAIETQVVLVGEMIKPKVDIQLLSTTLKDFSYRF